LNLLAKNKNPPKVLSSWTEADKKLTERLDKLTRELAQALAQRSELPAGPATRGAGGGAVTNAPVAANAPASPNAPVTPNALPPVPVAPADYEATIECWKQAVGVQMHFNDIALRIRGLVVTILVAAFGASGWALKEDVNLGPMPGATVILFVGGVAIWLFWFMDEAWYHRLLLGSVMHAIRIEEGVALTLPELGLSRMIGVYSPWKVPGLNVAVHSTGKMRIFYWTSIGALLISGGVLWLVGPGGKAGPPPTKTEYIDQYVRHPQPSPHEEAGSMCIDSL
jgi:hypothetical protein